MTYTGIIHGTTIQFDQQLPFTDGVQVEVDIYPPTSPRKGSPQAWLTHLAGTLTHDEAERILSGVTACRTIDHTLWSTSES
jgi:hypothetical protein